MFLRTCGNGEDQVLTDRDARQAIGDSGLETARPRREESVPEHEFGDAELARGVPRRHVFVSRSLVGGLRSL
jgi:hypothetical protein